MPRLTLGRLVTALSLLYSAALVFLFLVPGTGDDGSRQGVMAELVGPASYLLKPLGLAIDTDRPRHSVTIALLVLGLFQAALCRLVLRRRMRSWREPVGDYIRRFSHGPAIFRVAASYAAIVSAVAFWVLSTVVTSDGSMAGIWLFPLLGPAAVPFFLGVDGFGYLTFAGPVQAWLFWRLLRGHRVPGGGVA
ncbi:hypothetical protein [Actinomadura gamaensis]|uniref:Uncharacterized protein n=1 Tax=Actinomadura gamaensis TaxID=1763541 RepID=A0ABV9U740_9ACTN